ncbi:hypothetical protein PSAL_032190 [Pseudooceanicola algae]|uniref:Uncharacterized protein n=1 Tax=Pseudooceanicola algae TaxID=1537215 RepID=A0A418SIX5_9RHOB|nr:hypothetical protein PSAL_032190 [Pseudooceanicola algae]
MKSLNAFGNAQGWPPYGVFSMRLVLAVYWAVHRGYKVFYTGIRKLKVVTPCSHVTSIRPLWAVAMDDAI